MRSTEFTSAIQLIIEAVFADDFISAVLKPAFAPIHLPPGNAGEKGAGVCSGIIDLTEIFPTGRSQGGSENVKSVPGGVRGCPGKPVAETFGAALAFLRLSFQPSGDALPLPVVIIVLNYFKPGLGSIAEAFIEADIIFGLRENIGIAEENDGAKALIYKAFHNRRRAGGAAGVEQNPIPRRRQDKAVFAFAFHNFTFFLLGRQRP